MRQLLTWCATRAMHPKPQGTSFEEASARSAARVIEEELLRDIANKSELSDWFSREEAPAPVVPLPERPHPKNVDNAARIANVEEQLKRYVLDCYHCNNPLTILGYDQRKRHLKHYCDHHRCPSLSNSSEMQIRIQTKTR